MKKPAKSTKFSNVLSHHVHRYQYEKVGQDVADYTFKLNIGKCVRANFGFLIFISNFGI